MKCSRCLEGNPDIIEDESHDVNCPVGCFAWNDPRRKPAIQAFDAGDYDSAKVMGRLDPKMVFSPEMIPFYDLGLRLGGGIAKSTPPA